MSSDKQRNVITQYVNGLDKAAHLTTRKLKDLRSNMAASKNKLMTYEKLSDGHKFYVKELGAHIAFPDDPCLRCGYFFLSTDWIFGLAGKKDPMTPACALHDRLFGDPQGLTRKQVDKAFYDAMTGIIKAEGGGRWMRLQRETYYLVVRSVGWLFW